MNSVGKSQLHGIDMTTMGVLNFLLLIHLLPLLLHIKYFGGESQNEHRTLINNNLPSGSQKVFVAVRVTLKCWLYRNVEMSIKQT